MRGRKSALGSRCILLAFSIAFWSTILVSPPVWADPAALRTELAKTLPTLAEQGLTVSVQFVPVDRISDPDRVVSAYQNDPRIPASVTKLVTAAAALDLLGPRHTFRTRLARTGPIENGVLHGDLYIVGNGDPFLVSERLWLLANQLRLAGIDAITGRLVFDDSAWPKIEDWSSFGGSDRAYAATPSALAMNFNAVAIHITPGSAEGDPVVVRQDPFDLPYLTIENRLRTGKRGSAVRWSLDLRPAAPSVRTQALADSSKRVPGTDESSSSSFPGTSSSSRLPLPEAAYPSEIAHLEGTVPAGHAPFVAYRRAREPLALAGSLLHGFLRSAGVDHRGGIAFGPVPYDAVTILEFESLPLDDLVASMNRFSNNFIANQLALAIERGGSPRDSLVDRTDPLHRAGSALSKWLRETAGSADASHFADGSGLSARNRTTAQALVTLLRYAWNDLRIHGPFLASLPGPGESGTLDRRMRRLEGATIRAKTGSLPDEGVSTLAGYVQTPAGSPVAFAILMSSRSDRWNVPAMHDLQDRWIELYAR